MKKILAIIITLFTLSLNTFAQDITKEQWKNMSRQERKEYKAKIQLQNQQEMMALLTSKAWVLEAHQLQDRYGESFVMEPTLNFVGVAGETSTVQLGASGEIGFNGVGGITVEGRITKYELKEGKKPGTGAHIRMEITGTSSGHVSMSIQVSADGTASATLTDIEGGRVTYRGRIVSLAESSSYKGQVLF